MKWQFSKYLLLQEESRKKRFAMKRALVVVGLILLLKLVAFWITRANAVLSDSLESVIALATGSLALYSLGYSARPRDERHPFGTGKIEFMMAAAEGLVVILAALAIIGKAAYNLFVPHALELTPLGLGMVFGGAVASGVLGKYLSLKAHKFNSIILRSEGKRIMADSLTSVAAGAGLLVVYFTGFYWLDSLMAIAAGIFIANMGFVLLRPAIRGLLDEADYDTLGQVVDIMQAHSKPEWIDVRDLRGAHYGMYRYLDCKLVLPWYWNLRDTRRQADEMEELVNQYFREKVEMHIEATPCQPTDCPNCRLFTCDVRQAPYVGKATADKRMQGLAKKGAK